MNDFNRGYAAAPGTTMDASRDEGLRTFMLGVYNKLVIGILLAGVLAYAGGTVLAPYVLTSPMVYIIAFAPAALILGSMFLMRAPSPGMTGFIYWAVVVTIGLGFSAYVYLADNNIRATTAGGITQSLTYMTILKAFLITATAFGALSLWGYTTKRDLSGFGNFLIMGIWILFAVAIVYMILPAMGLMEPSGTMEWIISGGFALLSAGLVAWQTQGLKEGYYQFAGDARSQAVMTNWGALNFFIMFANMFRFVLMMLSSRD